jgi:hypothetical protein
MRLQVFIEWAEAHPVTSGVLGAVLSTVAVWIGTSPALQPWLQFLPEAVFGALSAFALAIVVRRAKKRRSGRRLRTARDVVAVAVGLACVYAALVHVPPCVNTATASLSDDTCGRLVELDCEVSRSPWNLRLRLLANSTATKARADNLVCSTGRCGERGCW